MAYTIPEYVDTQEQAILAVASAVKGEQVTGGDGSVNTALDILADALAGENVEVPMTNQGAILALAQYVGGGGGGGGVTLGDLHLVIADDSTVRAGDEINGGSAIMKISVGDAVVTDMTAGAIWQNTISTAATGATVDVIYGYINEGDPHAPSMRARTCTVNPDTYTYVTISDTIALEHEEYEIRDTDEPAYAARFVMPEIPEGSALLLSPQYS